MMIQFGSNNFFPANQDHLDRVLAHGSDCPFNFRLRGMISAHCVYGNCHHSLQKWLRDVRLLLLDFYNFAALVEPAMGASPMR